MKFDSNRAWQDASAILRAGRSLISPLAGIFFLLPAAVSAYFLADVQKLFAARFEDATAVEKLIETYGAQIALFGIGSFLVQSIGYLALMALMDTRRRPTVGESIASGARSLPTFIATIVLFVLGYLLASILVGIVLVPFAALGGTAAVQFIAVPLMVVVVCVLAVKLSLTLPAIVLEDRRNPVAAMVRSWKLTRANGLRLWGFFALLTLVYVIAIVLTTMLVVAPAVALLGTGAASALVSALVSGLVGATASAVFTAVLVATYRQLADDPGEDLTQLFV